MGPLVRQLVRRRQDALGAGIRKRSVESETTVRGRWLVRVVDRKTGIAFEREWESNSGGGRQDWDVPGTTIVSPMPERSWISERVTTLQRELLRMWMTSPCRRAWDQDAKRRLTMSTLCWNIRSIVKGENEYFENRIEHFDHLSTADRRVLDSSRVFVRIKNEMNKLA